MTDLPVPHEDAPPIARRLLPPLVPAALVLMAALFGGAWIPFALVVVAVGPTLMDALWPAPAAPAADLAAGRGTARMTVLMVAAAQVELLLLLPAALVREEGIAALLLAAAGALWLGQVANAAAHEAIHDPSPAMRRLGAAMLSVMLNGPHASSHRLVHHRWVASRRDPNSAPRGRGFWRHLPRAAWGGLRAGWRAEPRAPRVFAGYAAVSAAALAVTWVLAGWGGLAWHVLLAGWAAAQLILVDYVQHYGLRRARRADGRLEPIGPAHSWDADRAWSAAFGLEAARHADHHANPRVPFTDLSLGAAPRLPAGLPAMGTLALVPPLWRAVMDPRLDALRMRDGAARTEPPRPGQGEGQQRDRGSWQDPPAPKGGRATPMRAARTTPARAG